jgi:hypothetical protein
MTTAIDESATAEQAGIESHLPPDVKAELKMD